MIYLKLFEAFHLYLSSDGNLESNDDIIQTLEDICLDLKDEGFTIRIIQSKISNSEILKISKINEKKEISYLYIAMNPTMLIPHKLSTIKETIDRIKSYLHDKFICSVSTIKEKNIPTHWVDTDSLSGDDEILKTIVIFNI